MKNQYLVDNGIDQLAAPDTARRKLLKFTALTASTGLLWFGVGSPIVRANGKANTLLLSCMDYRLMDEVERYMLRRGLYHNYDHIVLAGASLGAITDKYPQWSKTFWDHLDLSVKLHGVHTVMIMDHRDCGAYKTLLGEDFFQNPQRETSEHATKLMKLKAMILEKYPSIAVETLLMNLTGEVEMIQNAPLV